MKKPSKEVIEEFKNSECWQFRLKFYETFGFTEEAFLDKSSYVREKAYEILGFRKEALSDKDEIIRCNAYKHFGFDESAFEDNSSFVRFQAYQFLGCPEKIFKDKDPKVRVNGYRIYGFSKDSLLDGGSKKVRKEAWGYFEKCRKILELNKMKSDFSEDEKELLRMNGVPIFDDLNLKDF